MARSPLNVTLAQLTLQMPAHDDPVSPLSSPNAHMRWPVTTEERDEDSMTAHNMNGRTDIRHLPVRPAEILPRSATLPLLCSSSLVAMSADADEIAPFNSSSPPRSRSADPTSATDFGTTIRHVQEVGARRGRHGDVHVIPRIRTPSPDPISFYIDDPGSEHVESDRRSSDVRSPTAVVTAPTLNTGKPGLLPSKRIRLKPRPFAHLLGRTRSVRTDPLEPTPKTSGPLRPFEVERTPSVKIEDPALRTAPIHEGDRSFREMMASTIRNRSTDRQRSTTSESGSVTSTKDLIPSNKTFTTATPSTTTTTTTTATAAAAKHHAAFSSSSFKDGTGSVLSSLKHSSTRAADGLGKAGKAGKGLFGKLGRSGSSGERESITDEHYELTVITLPLVQQTRRTRISKRLEDSRDKTEFWMPALAWRCIDYLNFKGCEEEGLYRVPGSGLKIKQWQRRFDTELDINLFDEPDLYDINIIGSMFKAWLRELPDEILPKATQASIAAKCIGATEVPQMLKDELSKLPPYHYYLLFAITCHLSLMHSYRDQNKMDFRNLSICFQPCLKMDSFCFQFLVCEWKHCWQGCWTEREALVAEYQILDGLSTEVVSADAAATAAAVVVVEERALSSSESSKPPSFHPPTTVKEQDPWSAHPGTRVALPDLDSEEEPGPTENPAPAHEDMVKVDREPKPLPALSPLAPLSPLRM